MRTRRGLCYPRVDPLRMRSDEDDVRRLRLFQDQEQRSSSVGLKRLKKSPENMIGGGAGGGCDFFEFLPDELVLIILTKLSSTATCPSDFVSALITCKRFHGLGHQSQVLSKVSPRALAVSGKKCSESAHRFLKKCADAGNARAGYLAGMASLLGFTSWFDFYRLRFRKL